MTNLKQNRNLNKLWTRSHPEKNTFLHVEKVYAYWYECIKMAGKMILPSNDTASIYIGKCTSIKQRTIFHVSGLLEHEEFIAKVWHAFASVGERRSLIVNHDRELCLCVIPRLIAPRVRPCPWISISVCQGRCTLMLHSLWQNSIEICEF